VLVNQDHISPEVIVTGFKRCCISDEIAGMRGKEVVGNVGNDHGSARSENGTR
jgi:hypothetical protein